MNIAVIIIAVLLGILALKFVVGVIKFVVIAVIVFAVIAFLSGKMR